MPERLDHGDAAQCHPAIVVAERERTAHGLSLGAAFDTVPAVALCGGAALYLLGHIAFLFRTTPYDSRRRTIGAAVLLALIPAAVAIPALATLAVVSVVSSLVVAYEAIRHRDFPGQLRHPESTTR